MKTRRECVQCYQYAQVGDLFCRDCRQTEDILEKARKGTGIAASNEKEQAAELLACPFCGMRAHMTYTAGSRLVVECLHCDASGPTGNTRERAIEAWNRRAGRTAESGEECEWCSGTGLITVICDGVPHHQAVCPICAAPVLPDSESELYAAAIAYNAANHEWSRTLQCDLDYTDSETDAAARANDKALTALLAAARALAPKESDQ